MRLPPAHPQTLPRVVGYFVFAMFVFGYGSALMRQLRGDPLEVARGIFTGASFGTVMITWDYFRLPTKDRLAPVHAIGLGLLYIGLVIWVLATRGDPITIEWKAWVPAVVVALLPMALIAAAVKQWRRETQASLRHRDGT